MSYLLHYNYIIHYNTILVEYIRWERPVLHFDCHSVIVLSPQLLVRHSNWRYVLGDCLRDSLSFLLQPKFAWVASGESAKCSLYFQWHVAKLSSSWQQTFQTRYQCCWHRGRVLAYGDWGPRFDSQYFDLYSDFLFQFLRTSLSTSGFFIFLSFLCNLLSQHVSFSPSSSLLFLWVLVVQSKQMVFLYLCSPSTCQCCSQAINMKKGSF